MGWISRCDRLDDSASPHKPGSETQKELPPESSHRPGRANTAAAGSQRRLRRCGRWCPHPRASVLGIGIPRAGASVTEHSVPPTSAPDVSKTQKHFPLTAPQLSVLSDHRPEQAILPKHSFPAQPVSAVICPSPRSLEILPGRKSSRLCFPLQCLFLGFSFSVLIEEKLCGAQNSA